MDVRVIDNAEAHEFEAWTGTAMAGFLRYRRDPDAIILLHTEVQPDFEGKGIGGRLAGHALASVRNAGGKAVVVCPFVASYLKRHPEYQDIIVRR